MLPDKSHWLSDQYAASLVSMDGHDSAASIGLTMEELRKVFAFLGAREAVNLDGVGSTAMYLRVYLVNHPGDPPGERAIGRSGDRRRHHARA